MPINRAWWVFFSLVLPALQLSAQVVPLPKAHAHNDYEHARPLLDALAQGFTSVEADVHLIDGIIRVAHDTPRDPRIVPDLQDAYLLPLKARLEKEGGSIYPGYNATFFLMIDIKTEAESTYAAIREALMPYREMLSKEIDGEYQQGAVTVFLSGNRPIETVLKDPLKLAFLDGRPADLGKGFSAELMPVISDNYHRHLSWIGEGPVPEEEKAILRELVAKVHAEGKKLRLWASPENEQLWAFLLDNGADLISTDLLVDLRSFMVSRMSSEKK